MFGSVPLYFVIAIIAGIGVVGILVGFCSCWMCKQCYLCYEKKNEARQRRRRKRKRRQQQQYDEYDDDDEYDEFDDNIYYSKQNANDNPRHQRPRLESHAVPRNPTKGGVSVFPSRNNDRHHIEDERGPTRSKTRQAGDDRNTSVAGRSTCARRHSPKTIDNNEDEKKGCALFCTYCCCCCDSLDDAYYYDSDDEESEDDENPKERGTSAKKGHAVAAVSQHTSSGDKNIDKNISNDKNRETSKEKPKTQQGPTNAKEPESKEVKAKKNKEKNPKEPKDKEMKEKNKKDKRNKGNACCAGCIIPSDSDDIEDSDYEEEWDYDDDDEGIKRSPNSCDKNIDKNISNDKNRETSKEKPKTQQGPTNAKEPESKEVKAKKNKEKKTKAPKDKEMKEKNKKDKRNKGKACCAGCIIPSDSDDIEDSDYEEEWDYDDDDDGIRRSPNSCDKNIDKNISNDNNRETSNEEPNTQPDPTNAKEPESKEVKAKKNKEKKKKESKDKEMKEKNKEEKRNKGNACCAGCIIQSDSDDIEDSDYEEEWDYDDDDDEIRRSPNNLNNKNGIMPTTAGNQKRGKSVIGRPKSNKNFIDERQKKNNEIPTAKDTRSNQMVCCCFGYESDDEYFDDCDDEYSEEENYDSDSLESPENKGATAIIGTNTAARTEGKGGRKTAKTPRPRSGKRSTSKKSKDNKKCKACFLCRIKCIGCAACCKKKQMGEEESNYDSDDDDLYDSDDDEDAADDYTVIAAGGAAASVTGVHASKSGKARVYRSKRKAKPKNIPNYMKKKRICCFVIKRSEKNCKQNTKKASKISKKRKVKESTANQNKTDTINMPNENIDVADKKTTKPPILVASALEATPEEYNNVRNDEKINNALDSSTTNNRIFNENRTNTYAQSGAVSGTQTIQNQGTRTNQNVTEKNPLTKTKPVESYMDAKYGATKPNVTFAEDVNRGQSYLNQSNIGKNYDGSSNSTKAKTPEPVLLTKNTAEKRNAAVSALFASSNTAVETSKVTGVNRSANEITKNEDQRSNANNRRSDDATSDVPSETKKTQEERKTERKEKKKEKTKAVMTLLSGSLFPKSSASSITSITNQTTRNGGQSLNHQTTWTAGALTAAVPVSLYKDRNTSNNNITDGPAEPERHNSNNPNESLHNTVPNGGAISSTNGYNPINIDDNQSNNHHLSGSENNGMQTTALSMLDSQHTDRKPISNSNQNQSGYNQPIRNDHSYYSVGDNAVTAMAASTAVNQTNGINTGQNSSLTAANQTKPPTIPVKSDGIPPQGVGMKARGRKNWKAVASLAVAKEFTMPNMKADWDVTGGNSNKGVGQDKREPTSKFAASVSAMMAKQHFIKAREPRKNEPAWDLLEGKPKDMQTEEIIPKTTMRKSRSLNTLFENETDIFSVDLPTKRRKKRQEDFDWDAISSMASERGANRPPRFNQPSILMDDSNPITNTRFQGGPSRRTSLTNIRH
ncbi:uncharacterized protein DDB_G0283697-like [Mizuhopecten yessoensis]|uniref:uncharacterized protein DDB_G0283697-like n=1 Tax=Mizuhopecten yessoensis TaxID=6573 RepID=UPI000B45C1E4|nr:uncharacterized protein DDB_G0283697-like [Mizuhopecten yessoensis]